MSGFLGKVGLIQRPRRWAALDWTLIAGGLITSLLTLYALLPAWNMAFWQSSTEEITERATVPWTMTFATVLVAASVLLAVLAGPIYRYAHGGAVELREQEPYISAVLPEAERGTGSIHGPIRASTRPQWCRRWGHHRHRRRRSPRPPRQLHADHRRWAR